MWARYQQANDYINQGLIRREAELPPSRRTRQQWMQWWLPQLEDPQLSFPAIHVAGTSGKGSVAIMIAEILRAANYRVGLHPTPYLQVATEKLWVDGRYASTEQFESLVQWIRPHAERVRAADVPLHGMASVALFLEHFRHQHVDWGVVEVGVGGRHDLTNVLDTKLAVVTNVGLDHLRTLGPTIEDIAWHKAGIIKAGCQAVVHARDSNDPALRAAETQAVEQGVSLHVVRPEHLSGAQKSRCRRAVLPRAPLEHRPLQTCRRGNISSRKRRHRDRSLRAAGPHRNEDRPLCSRKRFEPSALAWAHRGDRSWPKKPVPRRPGWQSQLG